MNPLISLDREVTFFVKVSILAYFISFINALKTEIKETTQIKGKNYFNEIKVGIVIKYYNFQKI